MRARIFNNNLVKGNNGRIVSSFQYPFDLAAALAGAPTSSFIEERV
jgi:hypothetical protein